MISDPLVVKIDHNSSYNDRIRVQNENVQSTGE